MQDFEHAPKTLTVPLTDATEAAEEYMRALKTLGQRKDVIYEGTIRVESCNEKRDIASPFNCSKTSAGAGMYT